MAANPSITDWISALSTAALGVLGFFITVWQWRRTGFTPRLRARIDASREAIELLIVNTGRSAGIIDQVDVVGPNGEIVEDVDFESFAGAAFRPLGLPAMASMRIIVQAPEGRSFVPGSRLLVGIGSNKPKVVIPVDAAPGIGIFGLTSVLPPGIPT
jgi:hypothetical protein